MRLHALAVLTVLALTVTGGGVAVAETVAPAVTSVLWAGGGPDDLMAVTATGFTPGDNATLALTDTEGRSFPLAPIVVSAEGVVTSPDGYRSPADVAVGDYHVVVTDSSGHTATSQSIHAGPPTISGWFHAEPGAVFDVLLLGMSGDPDLARAVTVDGVPLASRYYEFAQTGFGCAMGLQVTVPDTVTPGDHPLRVTQAGVAPMTSTLVVPQPTLQFAPTGHTTVFSLFGSRNPLELTTTSFGLHAQVVVSETDSAHRTATVGTFSPGTTTLDAVLPNVATGPVTITATNRVTGVTVAGTSRYGVPLRVGRSASTTTIVSGDQLVSPNGDTAVRIGTDGNLVLDRGWTPRWTSLTQGHAGSVLAFQPDGSIAVVTTGSRPAVVWSSHSPTTDRPTRLTAQDDGNLVLYSAHGHAVWSTRTAGGDESTLASGSVLGAGGRLGDPTTGFELRMQIDGNLVLYQLGSRDLPLFDTHTSHRPGASMILQSDGNLVVYSAAGKALWSNRVFPGPGARLAVQGDGNLVEYAANGKAVWSARTVR